MYFKFQTSIFLSKAPDVVNRKKHTEILLFAKKMANILFLFIECKAPN